MNATSCSPLAALLALWLTTLSAYAADEQAMTPEQFEATLHYQQGEVKLPNGVATLQIPKGFRYLGPDDAQRVLEQGWGNPDGGGTQGMLFPSETSPLAEGGWGVVITYEEDGHVSDEDADSIDYDALMKDMQAGTQEANAARAKQGMPAVTLVGWAAKPYYDKATRKLYWAKELAFGDAPEHTLNYNIRILGRRGVLVLNAVAGMRQLDSIRGRMGEVLAFTDFDPGHGYADFDPSVDKTAAYGLAALVAGGVAAKAGLFAKLAALLIAAKKGVALLVVAALAGLKRLFARKPPAA